MQKIDSKSEAADPREPSGPNDVAARGKSSEIPDYPDAEADDSVERLDRVPQIQHSGQPDAVEQQERRCGGKRPPPIVQAVDSDSVHSP